MDVGHLSCVRWKTVTLSLNIGVYRVGPKRLVNFDADTSRCVPYDLVYIYFVPRRCKDCHWKSKNDTKCRYWIVARFWF